MLLNLTIVGLVSLGRAEKVYKSSNGCFDDCIDEGYTFCPDLDKLKGTCYEPDETPKAYSWCSNAGLGASNRALQRWTCPNENNCGEDWKFRLPLNGDKTYVRSWSLEVGGKQDNFYKPDSCGYFIEPPAQATAGDQIKIKIWKKEQSSIYIDAGLEFKGGATT